jgi:hypothetical protein
MNLLVGLLLLAHGLIHLSYVAPAPSPGAGRPEWPFDMAKSWLVTNLGMSAGLIRPLGTLLVVVVAVTLGAAGLATLGVLVPQEWWKTLVIAGAVLSAVTLAIFFHLWIVLGIVIDGVLLYLVVVQDWQPFGASGVGGG